MQLYEDVDKPADEKYREEQHREENARCNLVAIFFVNGTLKERTLLKVVVPLASDDEDRRPNEERHNDKRENDLRRAYAS